MEYLYEAMDASGQETKGVIDADNQDQVQSMLRERGVFVTKISSRRSRKYRSKFQANFKWRWWDLWVGAYWDRKERHLYLCPLPTLVFEFWYS